jgi:hypothetical protein
MTTCTLVEAPSLSETVDDRSTLDELIVAVWEGVGAHEIVPCPVCAAEMKPEYSAHARPIGGRCFGCGSTLR